METYETIETQDTPASDVANSGSDYLLSSMIEIGFVIILTVLLLILYKLKDKWLFKKLNYQFCKMFLTDLINSIKEAVKKEAIEEKHEKKIEVKILDKMDEELFKKYESILQQKLSKTIPQDQEPENLDSEEKDTTDSKEK